MATQRLWPSDPLVRACRTERRTSFERATHCACGGPASGGPGNKRRCVRPRSATEFGVLPGTAHRVSDRLLRRTDLDGCCSSLSRLVSSQKLGFASPHALCGLVRGVDPRLHWFRGARRARFGLGGAQVVDDGGLSLGQLKAAHQCPGGVGESDRSACALFVLDVCRRRGGQWVQVEPT